MARPRQVTDDEILEVARACFEEDPNASTVTIAQRVGLSQAALFKRFGTKMRLMLRAMGITFGPPWVPIVEKGPDDRPVPEQLAEIGDAIVGFFRKMMPRLAVMKAVGLSFTDMFGEEEKPPPIVGYEALTAWFERAIEQGLVRDGDPKGFAIAFLGMFQARAFWAHFAGDHFPSPMPDDEAYTRHVVSLFWRGVAPEEAP